MITSQYVDGMRWKAALGQPQARRDQWGQAQKRLDEGGVSYGGPELGIEESMYFKDPDGIQIELLSDPLMYFAGRQLDE